MRAKKLRKTVSGNTVTIVESVTGSTLTFSISALSDTIQDSLAMHGLSQKLGDAAAGRSGQEAIDSINKVWEGLVKGEWTTRLPAAEKITKIGILEKFHALPPKEQAVARGLLEKLGLLTPA